MIRWVKHVEDTCASFSNDRCYAREAPKGCTTLCSANFQASSARPESPPLIDALHFFPAFVQGRRFMDSWPDEEGGGQERPTQSVSLSAILSGGSPFLHQQNHRRLAAPFSSPIILFARLGRVLAVSLIIPPSFLSLSQSPYALATGQRNVGVDDSWVCVHVVDFPS